MAEHGLVVLKNYVSNYMDSFLFYYLLSYIRNSTKLMLMDNLLTICMDHVFCEQNYMDSLFYMCDITNSTNICIIHVYLVVLLHFLYDPNDA